MAALIEAEEILPFLPNENAQSQAVLARIYACEEMACAQVESETGLSLENFRAQGLPADIKSALIKCTLAEYIASSTNTNYIEGDGSMSDRANRYRKEAQELLRTYKTPLAL